MPASKITIDQIPNSENETCEFKSSRLADDSNEFAKKLSAAFSGFSNTGGGLFVVGIDEKTGLVDGGVSSKVGRQSLGDWIDVVAHKVEPSPMYSINYIKDIGNRGKLDNGKILLIVSIEESHMGPHMAQDNKYYQRAGVHTVPARHFIIEAIRAKRYISKPKLTYLFRLKPGREKILQLGILALTDAPAVDVTIRLSPIPAALKNRDKDFPIKISVLDKENPFFFDVTPFAGSNTSFGNNITLNVEYKDLLNNEYSYEEIIGVDNSTQPITIGNDYEEKISKTLEGIKDILNKENQNKRFKYSYTPVLYNGDKGTSSFDYVQNLLPELINEVRTDLIDNPFLREFILFGKNWIYNGDNNNEVLSYYYEDHSDLRGKIRILENCGFVYNISFNDVDRFVMTEQFVQKLIT